MATLIDKQFIFQIKDKDKQIHEITSSVIYRQQDAIYGYQAEIKLFGIDYVDFFAKIIIKNGCFSGRLHEITVNHHYRNHGKGSLLLSAYFRTIQELEKEKVPPIICEQITGNLVERDKMADRWKLSIPFYANLSNHTYDAPDFNLACEFFGNDTHKYYPIEEGEISKEDFKKALENPTYPITNKNLKNMVDFYQNNNSGTVTLKRLPKLS